jgi:uncharacterized protein (DUF952 family)
MTLAPHPKHPDVIYKIVDRPSWDRAERAGQYHGSPDDLRDGFIHFSTAEQARETAAKYFGSQSGLVIAAISTLDLGASLRWEASRGGALFPHLYGSLAMAAVMWTRPLALGADGLHKFPMEMV